MSNTKLEEMLGDLKEGKLEVADVMQEIIELPFKDLGDTKLDTHREYRKGYPEVIFCEGKSNEQVLEIFQQAKNNASYMMGTRASQELYEFLKGTLDDITYYEKARILFRGNAREIKNDKIIAVVSGGTSDMAVAEEAAVTSQIMGCNVERIYDVGVTGLHRLLAHLQEIRNASVVVVVAGMEGALASVVGGLVNTPVICVPTSVGYGSHMDGLVPLLAMLNSCAPGSAVQNIDNGFGAGYMASLIVNQ